MKLDRTQVREIKNAFKDYNGHRVTKPQRKIFRRYGVELTEDRGAVSFCLWKCES